MKSVADVGSSYKAALRENRPEHRFCNSEGEAGNSPSEIDDVDDKIDEKGT